jgi:hypothetical protein
MRGTNGMTIKHVTKTITYVTFFLKKYVKHYPLIVNEMNG